MSAPAYKNDIELKGSSSEEFAAESDLKNFVAEHTYDPNLPRKIYEDAKGLTVKDVDVGEVIAFDSEMLEDSPYPEVRAAVAPTDQEDLTVNTIRMWVLGMIFTTLGTGINVLFSLREPSIYVSSLVAQLLSFPAGRAWDLVMPDREFVVWGKRLNLRPGPFNIKEHTVITIMANVSFAGGAAYSTDVLLSQQVFYGQNWGFGWQILLTLSSQVLGFGLAGLSRRFLVYPASIIWPGNLPNAALFASLHKNENGIANGWSVSRYRFFLYVFIGGFCWYWVPGFLFQGLSYFAFVTWIAPNNVKVNQIFGQASGISLLPLTFDWTQVTGYLAWWAQANILAATVFWMIFLAPILHYSNVWWGEYLPMSSSSSYDNTGAKYNVTRILTPELTLDAAEYEKYSPLFLSTTASLSYGLGFAAIMAVIVHTYLYSGKQIWRQAKATRESEPDVHARLMAKYPEAPDWWFAVLGLVMFGIGMGAVVGYPTEMPWWGFIVALLISVIFFIPIGFIQGVTNYQIGLNIISEFIGGYMLEGRPVANMLFKTYGYITMYQGMAFVADLKLGHYMKIPPRTLFWAQTIATLWSCFVTIGVFDWAIVNIKGICTSEAISNFTCPGGTVFYTASIVWGVIGPMRQFSHGHMYYSQLFFFLIGALSPIPMYMLVRRYPNSWLKYVSMPLFFGSLGYIPPATAVNYLSWCSVGFIFNCLIKRKFPPWWSKYNYVLSAGLDSGLAISTIVIFFCLGLTGVSLDWWGNTAVFETLDMTKAVLKKVVPGETFGPTSW
ncbi:hypothetical protein YB2330_000761 [Saitoella coloradoensis]